MDVCYACIAILRISILLSAWLFLWISYPASVLLSQHFAPFVADTGSKSGRRLHNVVMIMEWQASQQWCWAGSLRKNWRLFHADSPAGDYATKYKCRLYKSCNETRVSKLTMCACRGSRVLNVYVCKCTLWLWRTHNWSTDLNLFCLYFAHTYM